MEPILCLFCYNDISDLYKPTSIDEITRCPRCKALVTFTTDTSDVKYLFAELIRGTKPADWNDAPQIVIVTQPNIGTLYDSPGGEKIRHVSMVVGWDPNELLSIGEVFRILGGSEKEISHVFDFESFSDVFLDKSQISLLLSQWLKMRRGSVKSIIERNKQFWQTSRPKPNFQHDRET